MGIFDRFKAPLPEVPVGEWTTERVHARVDAMARLPDEGLHEGVAVQLHGLLREDLLPVGEPYVRAAGLDVEELASELYLHAWIGFLHATDAHVDREEGLSLLVPFQAALRDYVGAGWRERYDDGPGPILLAAEKISVGGRDPMHVVLGFLPMRLGVVWRRGGSEGLIRLAVPLQMAGVGVGEVAMKRLGGQR